MKRPHRTNSKIVDNEKIADGHVQQAKKRNRDDDLSSEMHELTRLRDAYASSFPSKFCNATSRSFPSQKKNKKRTTTMQAATPTTIRKNQEHRGTGVYKFDIRNEIQHNDVDGDVDDGNYNKVDYFQELCKLHDCIVQNVKSGVTWGEGTNTSDPRRRMYGFLPGKLQKLVKEGIKIQKIQENHGVHDNKYEQDYEDNGRNEYHNTNDDYEHVHTLTDASVNLIFPNMNVDKVAIHDDKDSSTANVVMPQQQQQQQQTRSVSSAVAAWEALEAITFHVQRLVAEPYRKYVCMEELVAIQPNMHGKAPHLPLHLDFPRNDGFGIVIVTLVIRDAGESTIVLVDDGDDDKDEKTMSWSFPISKGHGYVLSGESRNKCLHGVLCQGATEASSVEEAIQTKSYRETLNIRYGLHSESFAHDEILQYWPD